MDDWIFKSQNLIINSTIPHKTDTKLIQNCDLPPPLNLFIGPNQAPKPVKHDDHELNLFRNHSGERDKLGLFKALRFSQTRAREAEETKMKLAKEKDCVCNALMKDSMKLFAYKQRVWLLEVEVIMLRRENQEERRQREVEEDRQRCSGGCDEWRDENNGDVNWKVLALALCLGITLGCGYYYLF